MQYSQENTYVGVPSGLQLYLKETLRQVFSCEYNQIFKNIYFENICKLLLFYFYLPSFSKIIQDCYFMFSFWYHVTYFAYYLLIKNLQWCAVAKNTVQFTCTKNIGNRVKQYENLKKKLKVLNKCCFLTIKISDLKGNPDSQGILNWIIQTLHYYYRKQHKNIENSHIIE